MNTHFRDEVSPMATEGRFPTLVRTNYFHGQLLTHGDLTNDQTYFRERLRLHNRCLHGWGVVCGLEVRVIAPPAECPEDTPEQKHGGKHDPDQYPPGQYHPDQHHPDQHHPEQHHPGQHDPQAPRPTPPRARELVVHPGLALDCQGNEIILHHPCSLDLPKLLERLPDADRNALREAPQSVYLSICFQEHGVDPCRPPQQAGCPEPGGVRHARVREGVRFHVSLEAPPEDRDCDCEPCCSGCHECCVLLARIDGATLEGFDPAGVFNEVRRPLSRYVPTVITGVSWSHGATYEQHTARNLLHHEGLTFELSRPIRSSTLTEGVVDVWLIEGGTGRAAAISHVAGRIVDRGEGMQQRFTWRQHSGEIFNDRDRVLITLRTTFLLDRCCRPVEGGHVGGMVPLLPGCANKPKDMEPRDPGCRPPGAFGPWTTSGPGDFQSWFFIRHEDRSKK